PGIAGAYPLGLAFAAGWTPCVGPGLGVMLTLGATQGSAWRATLLLFFFSMGFGVWFLLAGLGIGFAVNTSQWLHGRLRFVQAVVSKSEMTRLLPNDSPRCLSIAAALGAASSSCSYAAVALARSLFRKGADFTASMAFEFASTNLVIELGVLLIVLIGWQFALAELVGGVIMIVILAVLFRVFLRPRMVEAARAQAERGLL